MSRRLSPSSGQLAAFAASFFRRPERLTPSQWCERHLLLPPGANESRPGKVDFTLAPYLRKPLDTMLNPRIREVVFVGPTRIGKTLLLRLARAYSISGDPASVLWIDSDRDAAVRVSIEELQPMDAYNAILRERKPRDVKRYGNVRMAFPGAMFSMVGAQSVAAVAGMTRVRLLGNEVDKWMGATEKEAPILELARHRTESHNDRRWHCFSSTPTLETGQTWQEYLKGDQQLFNVPCPDCGGFQPLLWDFVDWKHCDETRLEDGSYDLAAVRRHVRYRCAHCGSLWTQSQLQSAVRHPDAHWVATAKGRPEYATFHVNGLYGMNEANTMASLATDFLSARSTAFFTNRQDFWNSRMGLPWVDEISDLKDARLEHREAPYARGGDGLLAVMGRRADLLIIGVDVQRWGIPYVVKACNFDGQTWTVDHGVLPANCAASFADIERIQRTYINLGLAHRSFVIVDTGYADRGPETREAIFHRKSLGWYGARGSDARQTQPVTLANENAFIGTRHQSAREVNIEVLHICTYTFKIEMEKRLTGNQRGWHTYSLTPAGQQLSLKTDTELRTESREQADYYAQLLSERRVPRKRRRVGQPEFVFDNGGRDNHALDCEVYALALLYLFRARKDTATRTPKRDLIIA